MGRWGDGATPAASSDGERRCPLADAMTLRHNYSNGLRMDDHFFLIWIVYYYLDYYLDIYLFLDFLTLDDQEMITSQSSIAMKEQSKKHRSAADRWRLIPTVC